ncbi:hypothetical protein [Kingella sp. (in: b-proteobacteria)]|nr:hypothetical protein [Kingella sp. (in: b-proteobacteria)]MDO4658376.1 hypothetical protein [Kingella sp. (in: b-proteobacteria)]
MWLACRVGSLKTSPLNKKSFNPTSNGLIFQAALGRGKGSMAFFGFQAAT